MAKPEPHPRMAKLEAYYDRHIAAGTMTDRRREMCQRKMKRYLEVVTVRFVSRNNGLGKGASKYIPAGVHKNIQPHNR